MMPVIAIALLLYAAWRLNGVFKTQQVLKPHIETIKRELRLAHADKQTLDGLDRELDRRQFDELMDKLHQDAKTNQIPFEEVAWLFNLFAYTPSYHWESSSRGLTLVTPHGGLSWEWED